MATTFGTKQPVIEYNLEWYLTITCTRDYL